MGIQEAVSQSGNPSQPSDDRFNLCRGVEVVAGGDLRNVNVVWGHLFQKDYILGICDTVFIEPTSEDYGKGRDTLPFLP